MDTGDSRSRTANFLEKKQTTEQKKKEVINLMPNLGCHLLPGNRYFDAFSTNISFIIIVSRTQLAGLQPNYDVTFETVSIFTLLFRIRLHKKNAANFPGVTDT